MGHNENSAKRKTHSYESFSPSKRKKLERAYTSNLAAHLKALEQKEANTPKRSTQQEIIKLRAEINQVETKRTTWKSTKPGVGSLRKSMGDIRTETEEMQKYYQILLQKPILNKTIKSG